MSSTESQYLGDVVMIGPASEDSGALVGELAGWPWLAPCDLNERGIGFGHLPPDASPDAECGVLIRWGLSRPYRIRARKGYVNLASAVAKAIDKPAAYEALRAAGVPVPEELSRDDALAALGDDGYVVAREALRGCQWQTRLYTLADAAILGEQVADPEVRSLVRYYRAYRAVADYRVHVVDSWTYVQMRVRRENLHGPDRNRPQVRKLDTGWALVPVPRDFGPHQHEAELVAMRAVRALGLDFGAVDVLVPKGRGPLVCEVNTAPGLLRVHARMYALALRQYLNRRFDMEYR